MPGGKPQASPTASPPPELASEPSSVLKPVQNKIRNLRKAIDRATPLEAAQAKGDDLNPDQLECIRSKPVKVALLADLEEILKKQSIIVGAEDAEAKTSKRAFKRKEKEARAAAAAAAAAATAAAGTEAAAIEAEESAAVTEETPNAVNSDVPKNVSEDGSKTIPDTLDDGDSSRVSAVAEAAEHAAVSKVLDLLHVTDFLQTQDGKGSLLDYFDRSSGSGEPSLAALDMDILLYFATMLTTPNGNVAHPLAVDTSAAHCVAYLRKVDAEAFQGTTYRRLSEIVHAIGSCPLLARRGEPLSQDPTSFGSPGLAAEDSAISSVGPISESDQQRERANGGPGGVTPAPSGPGSGRRGGGRGRGRGGGRGAKRGQS